MSVAMLIVNTVLCLWLLIPEVPTLFDIIKGCKAFLSHSRECVYACVCVFVSLYVSVCKCLCGLSVLSWYHTSCICLFT